uniref:Uncharacterized protein n=1 Tax=Chlamydomonas euryale TaxID=1486919 RepID=A0A7R9YSY7_9CHLO
MRAELLKVRGRLCVHVGGGQCVLVLVVGGRMIHKLGVIVCKCGGTDAKVWGLCRCEHERTLVQLSAAGVDCMHGSERGWWDVGGWRTSLNGVLCEPKCGEDGGAV